MKRKTAAAALILAALMMSGCAPKGRQESSAPQEYETSEGGLQIIDGTPTDDSDWGELVIAE